MTQKEKAEYEAWLGYLEHLCQDMTKLTYSKLTKYLQEIAEDVEFEMI